MELEHLKIKCVFICNWIKKRQGPRMSRENYEDEEIRGHGRRKVIATGGRGAEQRRRGLDLSCSDASVVLLWCMFTALLALPYWCFHAFGKI